MSDIFEPETKPKAKPTPQFLRQRQVAEYESDIGALRKSLSEPKVQDKAIVRGKLNRMQRALEEQSAPDLTPTMKDKAVKRGAELEEKIREGMPSSEEMRKNPPGAVGKHMRWEKKNKAFIMEWKNVQVAMNKGSDDPDLANVERLRPATSSLNMHNAQISGTHFDIPSVAYMDNYDRINMENKELQKKILELKAPQEEASAEEK